MSAIFNSDEVVSDIHAKSGAIEIREGDWKAYSQSVVREQNEKSLVDRYSSVIGYKRACALAYLCKRAIARRRMLHQASAYHDAVIHRGSRSIQPCDSLCALSVAEVAHESPERDRADSGPDFIQ